MRLGRVAQPERGLEPVDIERRIRCPPDCGRILVEIPQTCQRQFIETVSWSGLELRAVSDIGCEL